MTGTLACEEAFASFVEEPRFWFIAAQKFISGYQDTSADERKALRSKFRPRDKFNLWTQYFEHIVREEKNMTDHEFRENVSNALMTASFDSFEYDYRETLLRLHSLAEIVNNRSQDWSNMKEQVTPMFDESKAKYLKQVV